MSVDIIKKSKVGIKKIASGMLPTPPGVRRLYAPRK